MRILVTGGSGFVGRAVVARLVASGHQVRVLARRGGDLRGAECVSGSIADRSSLDTAMAGLEAVIHLVGIIAECGDRTFEAVHTEGTRQVVEAARRAGIRRFLHMSALGARSGAASRYHQTKWAAEDLVRGSGLDWTIFRPSLIYGKGDGFVSLQLRLARWGPVLPVIGGGANRFQPVAVEEVAQAWEAAVATPGSIAGTYDLGGPDTPTYRGMLRDILTAAGWRRVLVTVPTPAAKWMGRGGDWLFRRVLRRPAPLSADQVLMLGEDNVGDIGPARRDLGFAPRPWKTGLQLMMTDLRGVH